MPKKSDSRFEPQYQMTDEFYNLVKKYLSENNITLKKLCRQMKTEYYMVYKILHRKIKMHSYLSMLEKIAIYCHIPLTIKLGEFQPTRMSFPAEAQLNKLEIAQKKENH